MSWFLVAFAFAFEAPATAAPAAATGESWHIAAGSLSKIADPVSVEAVFARYGVDTRGAALVSASSYARSAARRRVRVQRVNLGDGVITEPLDLRPQRGCAAASDDWSRGDMKVHTVTGRAGGPDATLVLVRDNPRIGSLVIMRPGDTLEVREVRRNGRVLANSVVMHRPADSLELRRQGGHQWICSRPPLRRTGA